MKLRISTDHLRLRVTGEEVNALSKGETVSVHVKLSAYDELVCELIPWNLEMTEAKFTDGKLIINVPASFTSVWPKSKHIAFEQVQQNDSFTPLTILIEMDMDEMK